MTIRANLNKIAAYFLGAALKHLDPTIQLATFSVDEDGFYYEFQGTVSINQFPKIEKQMQKFLGEQIVLEEWSTEKILDYYHGNEFKKELILKSHEPFAVHVMFPRTNHPYVDWNPDDFKPEAYSKMKFKILNVSGAYWHGDATQPQLTRINGAAFPTEKELSEFLQILQERQERDHRKIGKDLELFTFDQLAGAGLPIWLPNGERIKQQIEHYIEGLQFSYDFLPVSTPVIGSLDLYKTSGHWEHYKENMFPVIETENESFVLRPMTCPHHILVYKHQQYSYKQLPIRLCERSNLHRYEASGGLLGLERVREMVLEDTHIFCRLDQIQSEISRCYKMIRKAHEDLGLKVYRVDLSLNDPNDKEKYHDDPVAWEQSQKLMREALKENEIKFTEMVGEAAFYGPKIDFQVQTALGKIITVSTIQLDFLLPEKFDLQYKNEKGEMNRPVMVHLGLIGTYERYMAILLEQTKGILPLWLSPIQVEIIPVLEKHLQFSLELREQLKAEGIRVEVDDRTERVAKKIRDAQVRKIPYQLVIGDEELQNPALINYRKYGSEVVQTVGKKTFIAELNKLISEKK